MRSPVARILKRLIPRNWLYRLRVWKLRRTLRASVSETANGHTETQEPAGVASHSSGSGAPASEAASANDTPPSTDIAALRFSPQEPATAADVVACYRLFLGRAPDPEGQAAYTDAIERGGLDLAGLVESFARSAEFRERRAAAETPGEYAIVDLELFRMYVLPGDWSVSQSIIATGAMEPHVTAALKEQLKPGMHFVDVGANIGYFTMLGARLVGARGCVTAFEAAPRNCSLIYASAELNGFRNIRIEAQIVAEAAGPYLYQSSGSNGRIVPLQTVLNSGAIDSAKAASGHSLQGDFMWAGTLAEALAGETRVDVVKIDIEGAEYRAILGAGELLRKARPVLLTEFSPPQLSSVSGVDPLRYLELIREAGYEFTVLGEDGARIDCGASGERVLECYVRSAKGLLDLLCRPR